MQETLQMKRWGPHTPYFIVVVVALALPTFNLFDTLAFRCIPMARGVLTVQM